MKTTKPTKPLPFNEWVAYIRLQSELHNKRPDYSETKKALPTQKIILS